MKLSEIAQQQLDCGARQIRKCTDPLKDEIITHNVFDGSSDLLR